ncbi:MAG: hypothetical protein ACE364_03555 [Chlorobiota bacterium]
MKIFAFILSSVILVSCNLFSTRTPEEPDSDATGYIPPTSYDLVIENLKNSLAEKNLNNYLLCFSDSSFTEIKNFNYIATPQIAAQNQTLFSNWGVESEEKYFNSMITASLDQVRPSLTFTDEQYQNFSDSIIFTSNYLLNINFNDQQSNNNYAGNLRIVLKNSPTGFWYITSWYDFEREDTELLTWSFLRSKYYY